MKQYDGIIHLRLLIVMFATVIITAVAVPILVATSTSAAISMLENSGYRVLTTDEHSTILARLDDIRTLGGGLYNHIESETSESFIFPEGTDASVTLTTGTTANTFGEWSEVSDSNADTLSSKFTTSGFICEIICANHSAQGKRYMIEIACDDEGTKKVVLRGRTENGLIEEKSTEVPAGSSLYYRAMCEKANATLEATFRYHYYPQQLP